MNFVVDLKSIVVLPATIVLGKHFFDNARACISVKKNFGKILFFFLLFHDFAVSQMYDSPL